MPVIDADSHVIEAEHTWDFFDDAEARYRPLTLVEANPSNGGTKRFLSIDGRLRAQADEPEEKDAERKTGVRRDLSGFSQTTAGMRTLRDVDGRLRHMDELGVDIQVLYPTTMALGQISPRPEVDVAMSRSYNRWLAEAWGKSNGRLRWIAVPGALDMPSALDQVRWSVDHGACGVMMRGLEGDRLVSDPYFFPLYEEAEKLNVPICVHAGNANPTYARMIAGSSWSSAKVPVLSAFHHILYNEVPAKFPKLRFGFIEAAAGWVPYMITDLRRRMVRDGRTPLTDHPLADNRMYVACQTNDDLPYVIEFAGEDNLVIGTDYGHSDTSSELEALKNLEELCPLPPSVVHKILEDNPKALYGL